MACQHGNTDGKASGQAYAGTGVELWLPAQLQLCLCMINCLVELVEDGHLQFDVTSSSASIVGLLKKIFLSGGF